MCINVLILQSKLCSVYALRSTYTKETNDRINKKLHKCSYFKTKLCKTTPGTSYNTSPNNNEWERQKLCRPWTIRNSHRSENWVSSRPITLPREQFIFRPLWCFVSKISHRSPENSCSVACINCERKTLCIRMRNGGAMLRMVDISRRSCQLLRKCCI